VVKVSTLSEGWFLKKRNNGFLCPDRWDTDTGILRKIKREKLEIDNEHCNRVFLSYAHEDRLYTLCLHIFMRSHGIFLYVDWLFCSAFESGVDIKQNLKNELNAAEQFLFLRTINSELQIKGNHTIRGWCAWEMGVFYTGVSTKEKYYIELYSRIDRRDKVDKSLQLDGMKKLKSISGGRLFGI